MQQISTPRWVLEPLVVSHAGSMFEVLRDPILHSYLDFAPPSSVEQVRDSYAKMQGRQSPDGSQGWLNWIALPRGGGPIGYVQATTLRGGVAWVAYLIGRTSWGLGYAHEAMRAMLGHLTVYHGISRFQATVEADNLRSIALLYRLEFNLASHEEAAAHDLSASERLFIKQEGAEVT